MAHVYAEIPEPWYSAMVKWNLVSPTSDLPSIRQLATTAGLHPTAVRNVLLGKTRNPHHTTVERLAAALHAKPATIHRWIAGGDEVEVPDWTPPEEIRQLTPTQRATVDAVIRTIAAANRHGR